MHRQQRAFTDAACQPFRLEGADPNGRTHGALLLHGFTGSAAHMRPVAEALHARGFTVVGINLPGHATDMDDMARSTWDDWLTAAKEAFLQLKAECRYASVAGLSMGGCLTLILAEQMQPTSVAAISTPMGTKAPLWATGLAAPFMKTVWWRPRADVPGLMDDRYDYGYPGFRTSCGRHLGRLIKLARRDLHAVQCPLLVVQSHADTTITANSAEIILNGASSAVKRLLWLEDVPHACTISREAENIAAAMADHFRRAEE